MKVSNIHKLLTAGLMAIAAASALAQGKVNDPMQERMNEPGRYGGGSYFGEPDINATSAMIRAGGGVDNFTMERMFQSLMGDEWTRNEMRHLSEMYGRDKVHDWSSVAAFAVQDGRERMHDADWHLERTGLRGHGLATALVNDGTGPAHRFTSERLCDRLFSHVVHEQVMGDIDKKYGADADATYHQISNEVFYDMAQGLNMDKVQLAGFH